MFPFKLTPKRVEYLKQLDLRDCESVVRYFPRSYHSYLLTPLDKDHHDSRVVIKGIVKSKFPIVRFGKNKSIFKFKVIYQEEEYLVVAFNRPYLPPTIIQDEEVIVVGKYNHYKKEINMTEVITKGTENLKIKPLYRLPEGIINYEFSRFVNICMPYVDLPEIIPESLRDKYRLISRKKAYSQVHFPSDHEQLHQALRYLKYEELLTYSISLQILKSRQQLGSFSACKKIDNEFIDKVVRDSGFILTNDQEEAVRDIVNDLRSDKIMYRMLQGDVGSGKTLVATIGLVANYTAGYQGVLLAPTDILARQHYAFLTSFLSAYPIKIGLLVSSLSTKEKNEVIRKIETGEIDIIVGTHAVIQSGVIYRKLGFGVIDEQQRFGVKQRQALKDKGEDVELLMMSATPIPRTLAITLYGDMDISTLHAFPNKKRLVKTKVLLGDSIKSIIPEIEKKVENKERVFIVCPLIEDNEERRTATTVYEGLDKYFKGRVKVGLVHGRIDEDERNETMLSFQQGLIDVLVATTVIEVGIDIKDASMMVIYDAQSFGLSTLHQLRGRIGRGGQEGVCYLLCGSGGEKALERLNYLVSHDDGFDIARFDLASRGPGDVVGTRQSGIPDLNIANVYDDLKILEVARDDAKMIMSMPNNIENKQIIAYVARQKT